MALFQCNMFSESIFSSTTVNVILPTPNEGAEPGGRNKQYPKDGEKYQVLYLLHGFSGDYSDWQRNSGIERYAQERRVAVVMPSGGNSFYQNLPSGANYSDFILEELPAFVQGVFPISAKREHTFIAGLSMGGYGALLSALRKPQQYAAMASLSGALWKLDEYFRAVTEADLVFPVTKPLCHAFGADFARYDHTTCDLATMLQNAVDGGVELPKLYQCCGTGDFLYESNLEFKALAETLDIDYTYEEGSGAHDFDFWDPYIRRVLDWLPLTGGFVD